ncbi:hypothetical protein EDB87DRAFT_1582018 [Lactarius vividus]|nr:hypothetical protein EDB87DRAFT_1582018 [Lactarius vividus]
MFHHTSQRGPPWREDIVLLEVEVMGTTEERSVVMRLQGARMYELSLRKKRYQEPTEWSRYVPGFMVFAQVEDGALDPLCNHYGNEAKRPIVGICTERQKPNSPLRGELSETDQICLFKLWLWETVGWVGHVVAPVTSLNPHRLGAWMFPNESRGVPVLLHRVSLLSTVLRINSGNLVIYGEQPPTSIKRPYKAGDKAPSSLPPRRLLRFEGGDPIELASGPKLSLSKAASDTQIRKRLGLAFTCSTPLFLLLTRISASRSTLHRAPLRSDQSTRQFVDREEKFSVGETGWVAPDPNSDLVCGFSRRALVSVQRALLSIEALPEKVPAADKTIPEGCQMVRIQAPSILYLIPDIGDVCATYTGCMQARTLRVHNCQIARHFRLIRPRKADFLWFVATRDMRAIANTTSLHTRDAIDIRGLLLLIPGAFIGTEFQNGRNLPHEYIRDQTEGVAETPFRQG